MVHLHSCQLEAQTLAQLETCISIQQQGGDEEYARNDADAVASARQSYLSQDRQ